MTPESTLPQPVVRGRNQDVWVGIFVLLGVAILVAGFFILTSPAMLRGRYFVTAKVADAGGIRKGDPVEMRGVVVGRVSSFRILPDGVAVRLEIEGQYSIPSDSQIRLRTNNLLGGTQLDIIPGTAPAPAPHEAILPGKAEKQLTAQVQSVTGQASQTLERVQALLSPETVQNVQQSSAELTDLLRELAAAAQEQRAQLGELTRSLSASAAGLQRATAGDEPRVIVQRLGATSERLARASISLERSAQSAQDLLGRIERGEGTLGRLSRDDALYRNAAQAVTDLSRAAKSVSDLAEDIRREPKKYINVKIF